MYQKVVRFSDCFALEFGKFDLMLFIRDEDENVSSNRIKPHLLLVTFLTPPCNYKVHVEASLCEILYDSSFVTCDLPVYVCSLTKKKKTDHVERLYRHISIYDSA